VARAFATPDKFPQKAGHEFAPARRRRRGIGFGFGWCHSSDCSFLKRPAGSAGVKVAGWFAERGAPE
jgi:hypothetical protein